jgi:uncharacterized protein YegP (UPF0339 family)
LKIILDSGIGLRNILPSFQVSVLRFKNPKFEIYTDKANEYRFRLKARNGGIVATSEGYKTMDSCKNGVESVRKNAVEAAIV